MLFGASILGRKQPIVSCCSNFELCLDFFCWKFARFLLLLRSQS
ncbi:uncharacterized protein J3R85_014678 [Psidium guajava]|nr:uncharacterized protein J3R85_014678 [Psidium guajava]